MLLLLNSLPCCSPRWEERMARRPVGGRGRSPDLFHLCILKWGLQPTSPFACFFPTFQVLLKLFFCSLWKQNKTKSRYKPSLSSPPYISVVNPLATNSHMPGPVEGLHKYLLHTFKNQILFMERDQFLQWHVWVLKFRPNPFFRICFASSLQMSSLFLVSWKVQLRLTCLLSKRKKRCVINVTYFFNQIFCEV